MQPDLENLIRLQKLENSIAETQASVSGLPVRLEALEFRIVKRTDEVAASTGRLDQHRTSRAALEKDLAVVQGRLDRFKEQLMTVKTNKEYQAMQTEIASGGQEIQRLEDQLLECMLEADNLGGDVSRTEQLLKDERATAHEEHAVIEQERTSLEEQIEKLAAERDKVASQLAPQTMSLFKTLARGRKGVAVVEAREGRCSSCQVRLRPQLFNDLRSNNALIQCESCQRILYFAEHRHMAG